MKLSFYTYFYLYNMMASWLEKEKKAKLCSFVFVLTVSEKLMGVPLLRDVAGHVELNAAPFAADGLAIVYLAVVIVVAGLTYRWIEVPCRDAFRNALSGRRTVDVATE